MGATLESLQRLQEVELQIAEIQRRIDRALRSCKRQESHIADLDANIRAHEQQLRADQIHADRLDLEVKSNEVEINKLRSALNTAKTNKEYSAVLTQLNTNKADNAKIEERALALMSQVDVKRKELQALRDDRNKEAARLADLEAEVKSVEDKAAERLSRLRRERDQAADEVPPDALTMFNRVAEKNEGEALAMVVRTHPKRREYACEGCNMSITIEQVNAILSRDEAVLCNVCGRILYFESTPASTAR